MFRPRDLQMTTPIRIQSRVETKVNGQHSISYTDIDEPKHMCNFKPFHGSEALQAGTVGIQDGGTITMWYYPGITARDRILLNNDPNKAYEIINEPENVEMRNQFLILKVRRTVNA